MTLLDRVKSLCDARGETLASLERKMDFGNGTIRRWDNATPSGDKLAKVANYFHVSVDYLLGIDPPLSEDIDDESFVVLNRKAKNLSPEQRKQLLAVAKIMFKDVFDD